MAQIHIGRGTTKLGAFTEEEVQEGLHTGRFSHDDLGWIIGMENWKPLSDFPQLTPTPPALTSIEESLPRIGLPWDERDSIGLIPAFLGTIKLILLEPSKAFSIMQRQGGLGSPLLFAIPAGWLGNAAALFYSFVYSSLSHEDVMSSPAIQQLPPQMIPLLSALQITPIGIFVRLLLYPIFCTILLFVGAGLIHLCLLLFRGAKQSFETTFRVACFTFGATALFQLIPMCGGVISLIGALFLMSVGLAKAHETSVTHAITAVLLIFITCCCGGILMIATAFAVQ